MNVINDEISDGLSCIMNFVYQARYDKAFCLAKELMRKFPNEPQVQFEYAALLGDNIEGLPPAKAEKNRKEAVALIKKVVKKLDLIPEERRHAIMNEYYWFARMPLKQYQLGLEASKKNEGQGLYSQGVGAVSYAIALARKKKVEEVENWAQIANQAWLRYYDLRNKKYYNAYCWHARALGMLGEYKAMEEALEIARKLSGRDINYEEFVSVRKDVYEVRDIIEHKMKLFGAQKPVRPLYWYLFDLKIRSAFIELEDRNMHSATAFYKKTQSFAKKHPSNIYIQAVAAAVWGDWGQLFEPIIEKKMKNEAAKKLLQLKKKMKNEHWAIQGIILNEIAYHRSDFIGQYKVGLRRNKDHFGAGFFSMGVGASEYANQLFQKGKIREARNWARKSLKAWGLYGSVNFKVRPSSLNRNAFYAQASGILGDLVTAWKIAEQIKCDKTLPNKRWYKRLHDRLKSYEDLMK